MTINLSYGPPRSNGAAACALMATVMVVIMLVAQLYSFDEFAPVLGQVMQTENSGSLYVIAATLVIAELFSLPYLLGMYVSPLLRYVSAGLAFGVAGYWLFMAFTNSHAVNTGIFSSVLAMPGGLLPAAWAALLFFLVLAIISADSRFRHATS